MAHLNSDSDEEAGDWESQNWRTWNNLTQVARQTSRLV